MSRRSTLVESNPDHDTEKGERLDPNGQVEKDFHDIPLDHDGRERRRSSWRDSVWKDRKVGHDKEDPFGDEDAGEEGDVKYKVCHGQFLGKVY
jgi:hypothetical protein